MVHQKQSVEAWSQQLNFSMLEMANGLPAGLLTAVCRQESGGNPNAVSHAGAKGLFQFMPGTARDFGIDPLNPAASADAAAKYLGQHMARHNGDLAKALACYNWGQGNVQKAINKYGDNWLAHAPEETQNYVRNITGTLNGERIWRAPTTIPIAEESFEQLEARRVGGANASTEDNWLKQLLDGTMESIGSLGTMLIMLFAAVAGVRSQDNAEVASAPQPVPPSGQGPTEPARGDMARAQEQARAAVDGCSIPGNGVCVAQADAQSNLPNKMPWEVDLGLRS